MGAGIPAEIPQLLDRLAAGVRGELTVSVAGAPAGVRHVVSFDPTSLTENPPRLKRPRFLAIVSSAVLAAYLVRDPVCAPDGFVLETCVAGGHSAPPRGALRLSGDGEPVYGPRDVIDVAKVAALGLPFWLAGGHAGPAALGAARALGAAGIQVGTAFALCQESGLAPSLRRRMLEQALAHTLVVRNEPRASPAGFPFKTVHMGGTASEEEVYAARTRLCDLGYLRTPFAKGDGGIGYRCSAEPVAMYVRKGGTADDAADRRCLCNGLSAAIGLAQRRPGADSEPPLLTLGQSLDFLPDLVARAGEDFTAADVVAYLLESGDPDGSGIEKRGSLSHT
jgi:NAD(P)H-dependent flavin oxidoreductase YrpB (nitropropane dioxygenase family)